MSRIQSNRHALSIRRRAVASVVVALLAAALLLLGAASQGDRAWADDGDQLAAGAAAAAQLETQATSNGTWVLTSKGMNTPGDTKGDHRKYSFSGSVLSNGYVQLVVSGGVYDQSGFVTATHYHECSQPKASYGSGETATLTMRYYTKDSTPIHYNGDAEIDCFAPKQAYFGSAWYGYFREPVTREYRVKEPTDATFYDGDCPLQTLKTTFTFPSEAEIGEQLDIVFLVGTASRYEEGPGLPDNDDYTAYNNFKYEFYKWSYTFKATPAKAKIASIKNVKGAKAKVNVKKVKGAQKYQVRYKAANMKKWKVVKAKKSRTFVVKVAKGKKMKAQARACNAAGWGKWGKAKSFKTDRR